MILRTEIIKVHDGNQMNQGLPAGRQVQTIWKAAGQNPVEALRYE